MKSSGEEHMVSANEAVISGVPVTETPSPPAAWKRWSILALLAVGALIAFVDRTSISSALAAPSFKHHFHLSNLDRGWINSAFFWSYAALQIPMGWVVDRYGVKRAYTVCFIIWCAASALTGLTTTLAALIVMRLVVGAAEAVVVPASYRWIRNNFHEGQSGTAVGLYMLGTKFGPAIGAPVAAWLIVAYDWRAMFFITGAVGLVWLLPWLFMVKNDLPKKSEMVAVRAKASAVPMKNILASPLVWGTLVVNFCYNYFTFYCMTWMPAYLVEHRGLTLEKMGLYSFFSFAGIAIVALAAGWVADKLIARGGDAVVVRKSFVIAGFLVASTVILGAKTDNTALALFWNVFSLSGLGLATANNLALCRLTLIPKPAVGVVTGIQQVAVSLAGMVAPILSGWLLDVSGGYTVPMYVIFAFLLLGAVTTLFVLRRDWAPKVPEGVEI
jgi:ACS family D-galactonate transporter-like MFS transporter